MLALLEMSLSDALYVCITPTQSMHLTATRELSLINGVNFEIPFAGKNKLCWLIYILCSTVLQCLKK